MDVVKKIEERKEQRLNTVNVQDQGKKTAGTAARTSVAHPEIPGLRHETKDVLKQLQMNIQLIEDLGGRLGYVMSEIRTIIRR